MINALYVASLIVTGLIVVALAAALLTVLFILWRTSDTLGKVIFGVRAIAQRAEPIEELVGGINAELLGVRGALQDAVPGHHPLGDTTDQRIQERTVHR
jgi:hypothetical protein